MRKRFTEEEFRAMRVLINNGATGEMLMQAFGVGRSLITRVRKANSWSEYREMLEAMAADVRKRNQEKATKVNKVDEKVADPNPVPASKSTASQQMMASNYQLNRLYELMKEETEYLKLISAKLAFIVESLA